MRGRAKRTVLPEQRSEAGEALVEDDKGVGEGRAVVGGVRREEEGGGVVDDFHYLSPRSIAPRELGRERTGDLVGWSASLRKTGRRRRGELMGEGDGVQSVRAGESVLDAQLDRSCLPHTRKYIYIYFFIQLESKLC